MSSLAFHNNTFDMNNTWYNSHKEILEKVAIELGCADKIVELSEKLLGPKHKMKKHKDLNAPKKPKTGFMHFCDEFRPEVNKKNPELKLGGVMKVPQRGQVLFRNTQTIQHLRSFGQQVLRLGNRHQPAPLPQEQGHAQVLLQRFQRSTHGRLRTMQIARSLADRARFHNFAKSR